MDVHQLATTFQPTNWTTEFADKLYMDVPSQLVHAECGFLARKAREELAKGRVGRARNWLALSLYLDSANVLAHFKRVGFFRASQSGSQGKSLLRLAESILEIHSDLRLDPETIRYLESVQSLLTLAVGALQTYHVIVRQLRKREKGVLIRAMVECVRPEPGKLIADPACGTGGFFLAGYDFIANEDNFKLDKPQKEFLKHEGYCHIKCGLETLDE